MMTRKHFVKIAEILKKHNASFEMIREFVHFCQADNPNFEYHKFQKAAGMYPD